MLGTVEKTGLTAPVYNLKAVVKKTNLKPSTIRAWERRYGLPQPRRTAGGHRKYSQRDIDTLNWLVARQEEGMSISHAVQLWQRLNNQKAVWPKEPQQAVQTDKSVKTALLPKASTEISKLRDKWVDACLAFDRAEAEQILANAFALFPPEIVAVRLLQAGLSRIGALWYEGRASIQQEHFASAMSVQRLDMLIAATAPPTRPERLVIASVEDDYHVFSPLLFTFLFRRRGFDVLYLGANMPAVSLAEMVDQIRPAMLILSAQTLSTASSLLSVTEALVKKDTIIGYGGTIFNMLPQLQQHIPAHYLGPTIDGAVPIVERLIRQRTPTPSVAPNHLYSQALREYQKSRSLIESDVWSDYSANGKPTGRLSEMNQEMAGLITAALIFGESDILSREMAWANYFSSSYRLSEAEVQAYLARYYQATEENLGDSAQIIVDWLQDLSVSQEG
jgi:DNA-binding transcriptional MerR regulator/methylmalonyl-CoA mutase cobalamin-binding subunit